MSIAIDEEQGENFVASRYIDACGLCTVIRCCVIFVPCEMVINIILTSMMVRGGICGEVEFWEFNLSRMFCTKKRM